MSEAKQPTSSVELAPPAKSSATEAPDATQALHQCPLCRASSLPGSRFCSQCGARLSARNFQSSRALDDRGASLAAGQRRQLTMLFCDMVGSTSLSTQLDPEDLRDVLRRYQEVCAEAVQPFDGLIAQTMGDGLLIYFGYPEAHEDSAERAVRAGLAIVDAIAKDDPIFRHRWPARAVRIGIDTGIVFVGDVGEWDSRANMAVVGESPNVAARLQHLAARNGVVIGARTRCLVGERFRLEPLGPQNLAGLTESLEVWRVEGASAERSHGAQRGSRDAKLVGREAELEQLRQAWRSASLGHGRCVAISGPAGIGKSRLVAALEREVAAERPITLRYQCSPYFQNTLLYPVINQLRHSAHIHPEDAARLKLRKLERLVRLSSNHVGADVALVAQLLQIPNSARSELSERSPQRLLDDIFGLLEEQLAFSSSKRPVLLLLEDAHWVDPTTLGLLRRVLGRLASLRILAVVTSRSEDPWRSLASIQAVTLDRLATAEARTIVAHLPGTRDLTEHTIRQIVTNGDGVPLFLEELTRAVVEAGPNGANSVPSTLQDSLTARLDRIGPLKIVAQLASCIGRSFSYLILQQLAALDEPRLREGLRRLESADILIRTGELPEAVFTFRHALLQSAAYESLLRSERRLVHARIAATWCMLQPGMRLTEPEVLAQHFGAAGDFDAAAADWLRAGLMAQRRSAHREAIAHLEAGLAALEELPASRQRDTRAIDFFVALARSYMAREGWAAPRMNESYTHARELCRSTRATRREWQCLWGIWSYHAVRGEYGKAREHAMEYVQLAEDAGDRAALLMADSTALVTHFMTGDFHAAEHHAERVFAQYRHEEDVNLVHVFNHDPAILASEYAATWQWISGYADTAERTNRRAIEHARRLNQPFQLCKTLIMGAGTLAWWGDVSTSLALADEALALAREHRMRVFDVYGPLMVAPALAAREPTRATLDRLHRGLEIMRSTDANMLRPLYLLRTAEAHERLNEVGNARVCVQQALDLVGLTGELWVVPELHRTQARLFGRGHGGSDEMAEQWLESGIKAATGLGARSFELRLACDRFDLASHRRLPRSERQQEKWQLQRTYEQLREGRDTPDLRRARALLKEE